jgi:hypothetical protein
MPAPASKVIAAIATVRQVARRSSVGVFVMTLSFHSF